MVVNVPVFLNHIKVLLFSQPKETALKTVADFANYSPSLICYKSEAQTFFCYFCPNHRAIMPHSKNISLLC